MEIAQRSIDQWVELLSEREIPVMRQTVRGLADALARIDSISGRAVAAIVLHDPLMTVRVLRFTLRHHAKRQLKEISTVDHAVMMLGIEPFFKHFAQLDIIEEQLATQPQALLGLLHTIRRAQRATYYASDWAASRRDLNVEEITVGALLHDLAEMLMWCFAPEQALQIQALQQADHTMRSADAQQAVLGFRLIELQLSLCKQWGLPDLLLQLIDDTQSEHPRVKNVKFAVDLARHSSHGWDDPALPDDFAAIEKFMNIEHDALLVRLGLPKPDAEAEPAGDQ
jgi:HD-like signal output (HDOD) protein